MPSPIYVINGQRVPCAARWPGGSCGIGAVAKGLCDGHWRQQYQGKQLRALRSFRPPNLRGHDLAVWCVQHGATERGPGSCRIWKYALRNGYPVVRIDGGQIGVHRLVAEHLVAMRPLTSADVVHHRCAETGCILPADLQVTTAQANTAEMRDRNALLRRIAELEAENAWLRSNMTKSNTPDEAKLVKGPGYEPPQIARVLGLEAAAGLAIMITVCDRCLRACCWKGIFMCYDAKAAGTRELSAGTLSIMDREHSDYWDGTYERGIEEADAKAHGEGVTTSGN